jgi:hypothetical protein
MPFSLSFLFTISCLVPVNIWCMEKPKVRTVTAFVRLDRNQYQKQIADALVMLRQAQAAFVQAGYEVQTLRITTQPFPEYVRDLSHEQALALFCNLDSLAAKEGFIMAIGPAMLTDFDDPHMADLLIEVLSATTNLDGSMLVAAQDGIHWKGVHTAAHVVKALSERTPHSQGGFHFAAMAMVSPMTPFYPSSYHLGPGRAFTLGLQSANLVAEAFSRTTDPQQARVSLDEEFEDVVRAVASVGAAVQKQTGWLYAGLDVSPAPLKEVSIGAAIERLTGAKVGASGTLTAATIITTILHDMPAKMTGFSGLMLPVLEDSVLAQRWSEGTLRLDSLLVYSAVCGTGLDTVPLPGDITKDQLAKIIGDVASLAVKLRKPLSARLLPVAGKTAGQRTEFDDPYMVNATIQAFP